MNPRLQIAAMIFQGMVANPGHIGVHRYDLIAEAVDYADGLIAQEEATREPVQMGCPDCDATGIITDDRGSTECPRCNGTGVER